MNNAKKIVSSKKLHHKLCLFQNILGVSKKNRINSCQSWSKALKIWEENRKIKRTQKVRVFFAEKVRTQKLVSGDILDVNKQHRACSSLSARSAEEKWRVSKSEEENLRLKKMGPRGGPGTHPPEGGPHTPLPPALFNLPIEPCSGGGG